MDNPRKDVAVFFDFENIVYSLRNNYGINANFEDLMDKCNEFGRVVVARAFADWNRQSSSMIPALISNGFDPVYVPSFYTNENGKQDLRKNAVDMYMAIDAMDILHNRKNVDTFILLTGDSDFLPVVTSIRREGNRVIAIGVDGTVSSHLAQAVDEFIFYSQVSTIPETKFKKRPKDVYDGLVEAIKRLQKENRSTVLPNVKMMMGELLGGFDEKKHTDRNNRRFQKFKEFVQEGERRGIVQLVTTGTVNEVFLADEDVKGRRGSDAGKKQEALSLGEAYDLLVAAVDKASKENRSMRTSSIKGIMTEMRNDFDEKQITLEEEEEGFSRFSDFVQAAEKKGLVSLVGESTKLEIHPVEEAAAAEKEGAPTEKDQDGTPKEEKKGRGRRSKASAKKSEVEAPLEERADEDEAAPVEAASAASSTFSGEELEGRQLIVDGLHSFQNYPASFLQIEAHCRQVRNDRSMYLPSPKVRELLTEATRELGILKRISPPGVSPAQYELNATPELVARFLGSEPADAAPAPAAKKVEKAEETKGKGSRKGKKPEKGKAKGEARSKADKSQKAAPENAADGQGRGNYSQPLVEAFDLLSTAITKSAEAGRSLKLSAIKKQMKQLNPEFDESSLASSGKTFKRFSDFVRAAQVAGVVNVQGEGAQAEVHLID